MLKSVLKRNAAATNSSFTLDQKSGLVYTGAKVKIVIARVSKRLLANKFALP